MAGLMFQGRLPAHRMIREIFPRYMRKVSLIKLAHRGSPITDQNSFPESTVGTDRKARFAETRFGLARNLDTGRPVLRPDPHERAPAAAKRRWRG